MAAKKSSSKRAAEETALHFHIPADPLRLKSEEIHSRHSSRRQQSSLQAKSKDNEQQAVTLEMLYDLLVDVLEKQAILESRLEKWNGSTRPISYGK